MVEFPGQVATDVLEKGPVPEELIQLLPCAALVERDGRVVAWNPEASAMRRAENEPVGIPVEQVLLGAYPPAEAAGQGSSTNVHFDCALLRADGRLVPVRCALRVVDTPTGAARMITLVEHGLAENASAGEGTFLGDLLDAAPEPVAITRAGRVLYVNREFTQLFGYATSDCLGLVLDELITPPRRRSRAADLYLRVEEENRVSAECVRLNRDGERIAVSMLIGSVNLPGGEGNGLFHSFRDIRPQKKTEAILQHRAMHDALTGLANRALLLDRISVALKRLRRDPARSFAVLFLDLDGFKPINDSLGHEAGDAVLREVALRVRDCLRPQDTLARFGGDEFAMLVEEVDSEDGALNLADRVQAAVQSVGGEWGMKLSASVGLTTVKEAVAPAARVLREADIAMYQAKAEGKACAAVYAAGMTMKGGPHGRERSGRSHAEEAPRTQDQGQLLLLKTA